MNKELTKEEAEEYYNKLWLENKELIQENIDKLNTKRFALEMELIDKDKEIERLNNLLKKTGQTLSEQTTKAITLKSENKRLNNIINELEKELIKYFEKEYTDRKLEDYNLENCTYDYALVILGKLQELKGSDK